MIPRSDDKHACSLATSSRAPERCAAISVVKARLLPSNPVGGRNDNHHHRISKSYNSSNGFTLLELIISISLIGIIVLIVTGAMRLGIRSFESSEKRIAYLERTRSSLNIIDSQIQSYLPLVYKEDGKKKYYFKADRETLQFSTNYSIWGGEKGYVITTYSVKPLENGKQAIFASETVAGRPNKSETMLTNPFERIYFEFYSRQQAEETGTWSDRWEQKTGVEDTEDVSIPEKVKIHLIEGAEDLAFVVPIRVRMSAADLAAAGGFEEEFFEELEEE